MEPPFVGTPVAGPDAKGTPTHWAVISCHPVVVGLEDGRIRYEGWVAWLMAPDQPMLCVSDRAFATGEDGRPAAYRVVLPS